MTAATPRTRTTGELFTVVGGVNTDTILHTATEPQDDGTVEVLERTGAIGGHGANTALALARLGHRVRLVAAVGGDQAGEEATASLRAAGVDTGDVVRVRAAQTGQAVVVNGPRTRHMMLWRGANDLLPAPDPVRGTLLLLDPPLPTVPALLAGPRLVVANPGGRTAGMLPMLCAAPGPVVLVCNRTEFEQAGGAARLPELVRTLTAVVVTEGERGCLVLDAAGSTAVPARPATAVDPTGAGDAFTAGLAAALAGGARAVRAAGAGAALAALAVEVHGGPAALPAATEVRRRLDADRSREHRNTESRSLEKESAWS
ncbi:ribokinase [Kitasatospora nipponensis]|uniref:Ribokinase n=1 Tax=Kitasatospora nipponensis TaxID=258049 RepID=A0ABN1W0F2_9ACTN